MANIKLLDCTLRDGGYLNSWRFGKENISFIIDSLIDANIDIVECGFLTGEINDDNHSLYSSFDELNCIVNRNHKYALMLNFGVLDAHNIVPAPSNLDTEIRIAFKQHNLDEIVDFCKILENKNIKYSLNPMHTSLYDNTEYSKLVNISNDLNPTCITVVDTMGVMTPQDTSVLFSRLNSSIKHEIPLGFHSHNNMNNSYLNIKTLFDMNIQREIIIDTSLCGIGRGGGMPSTEKVAHMLNSEYGAFYNIDLLNSVSTKIISPIAVSQVVYKEMYYISAQNSCHPNYALYLIKNNITDKTVVNRVLSLIPDEHKTIYNPKIIESIVNNSLTNVTL